jgi:hypothetical protein
MVIRYVPYGTVRVSERWRKVLRAADKAKVPFHVTSGHRTMAEQTALFKRNMVRPGVPRPGRPMTAVPNPNAPHIFSGRHAHALDVDSLDGGETRLQKWLERKGAKVTNPVKGESWHMVVSGQDLKRLAEKLDGTVTERDAHLAEIIDRFGGNGFGLKVVQEARRSGIPISLGAALVEQESNFRNVFGHDPVKTGQIKGGPVTRARYLRYKAMRKAGRGMQGVGLTQLTFFAFQDRADKLGGAWKPANQLRVGFQLLRDLIEQHGQAEGIARYNGTGPAAERYSREVRAKQNRWHDRLTKES